VNKGPGKRAPLAYSRRTATHTNAIYDLFGWLVFVYLESEYFDLPAA
jgi:hypothetical protein